MSVSLPMPSDLTLCGKPARLGPPSAHFFVQGCKVRATKQITINAAPNVLVVHLKRFEYSLYGHKISKKVLTATHLLVPCDTLLLELIPFL